MMERMQDLLREHAFLRGLDARGLEFLAGCASNRVFGAGELLFREGEDADATYLVRAGRIALEIHVPGREAVRFQTVSPGEAVGWSWLFPPYRWHFDARALDPVRAIHLDGGCLRAKCESDHDFGFDLAKRFLRLVHERLERTRMQVLDVYGRPS